MKFMLSLMIFCGIFACNGFAQDSTLIEFEIKDQFGRQYNQTGFTDSVIILLGADRQGSKFTDLWGTTLADSLRQYGSLDQVVFVALADLRAVPKLMRGMIKSYFPDNKEKWVLMDWQGRFAIAYDFRPDHCNILIFNQNKKLIFQTAVTEYQETVAKSAIAAVLGAR